MNYAVIILWILVCYLSYIFLFDHFFPYVYRKFIFWSLSRRFKSMASKYDGKLKDDLMKISDGLKSVYDEEKL